MGRHYISKEARCPFYRHEDRAAVYCEGVEDGTSIKLLLPDEGYKAQYCRSPRWKSCLIARMLWDKYD